MVFVLAFVVYFGSFAERLAGIFEFAICLLSSALVPGFVISFSSLFFYISTQKEAFLYVFDASL